MMSVDTQSYEDVVDCWIGDALGRGVESFHQLLLMLPGVYPSAVLSSLQRLAAGRKFDARILEGMAREVRQAVERESGPSRGAGSRRIVLPTPHPLDYDWRFGASAVKSLLDSCLELTKTGDSVLLLGAHSLFRAAAECAYPRRMILLDASPSIVACFKDVGVEAHVELFDAFKDKLPELAAAVVVVDPPWYEEHLAAFMWVAEQLCADGGHILVSVPPLGTRPGMEQERANLFCWTQKLGLSLKRLEPAALAYVSPPFERNALRTEGILNVPEEWRRGDLAVFSKGTGAQIPRPALTSAEADQWVESSLSGVRMWLRKQCDREFVDPTLLSLVPGDILPTPSRRDERRPLVDVWTSGNRVFACRGRNTLRLIIDALAAGASPEDYVAGSLGRKLTVREGELAIRAAHHVDEIVRMEQAENDLFGGDPKAC